MLAARVFTTGNLRRISATYFAYNNWMSPPGKRLISIPSRKLAAPRSFILNLLCRNSLTCPMRATNLPITIMSSTNRPSRTLYAP